MPSDTGNVWVAEASKETEDKFPSSVVTVDSDTTSDPTLEPLDLYWEKVLPYIRFISSNEDAARKGLKDRGIPKGNDITSKIRTDYLRYKEYQEKVEGLRNKIKKKSDDYFKTENEEIKNEVNALKDELSEYERRGHELKRLLVNNVSGIPNLNVLAPLGKSETENVIVGKGEAEKPHFNFSPKDHVEIGTNLRLIDVERATKVSGTRFAYLQNAGVSLEFALINFALEKLRSKGFAQIIPPTLIKKEYMWSMGYITGHSESETYKATEKKEIETENSLYLTATSEQSVGPYFANETLEEEHLPLRFAAFSSCYRREAGTYGDIKGLFRVHQFDKVEMLSFCHPDKSEEEHKYFLEIEKELFEELGLNFIVKEMCSGDLGFVASKKYDIEGWFPGRREYRELTSTSNTTNFQAMRLNIKFKNKSVKEFVHIINGTAFAIGRTISAILENYQQKDGSVLVPEVLQKYTGFTKIPQSK